MELPENKLEQLELEQLELEQLELEQLELEQLEQTVIYFSSKKQIINEIRDFESDCARYA